MKLIYKEEIILSNYFVGKDKKRQVELIRSQGGSLVRRERSKGYGKNDQWSPWKIDYI